MAQHLPSLSPSFLVTHTPCKCHCTTAAKENALCFWWHAPPLSLTPIHWIHRGHPFAGGLHSLENGARGDRERPRATSIADKEFHAIAVYPKYYFNLAVLARSTSSLSLSLSTLSSLSHTHAHSSEADHPYKGIVTTSTEVPKNESGRDGKRSTFFPL